MEHSSKPGNQGQPVDLPRAWGEARTGLLQEPQRDPVLLTPWFWMRLMDWELTSFLF